MRYNGVANLERLNDRQLAVLLQSHVNRERWRQSVRRGRWFFGLHYLDGYRMFQMRDRFGTVIDTFEFEGKESDKNKGRKRRPFKTGTLVKQLNDAIGAVASLDLRPKIERQDKSLRGLREAAMARVVANATINEQEVETTKALYSLYLSTFGCVGLQVGVVEDDRVGLMQDVEVVHPMECFSWPSVSSNLADMRGIVRHRFIPLADVKARWSGVPSDVGKMEYYTREMGYLSPNDVDLDAAQRSRESHALPSRVVQSGRGNITMDDTDTEEILIGVTELYVTGLNGMLDYYAATSGETTFVRQNLTGVPTYCPLVWTRFLETGGFYGVGMVDLLWSQIREFEEMVERFSKNIRDQDRYGMVVLPHGVIHERMMFQNTGAEYKIAMVSPEPGLNGERPFQPQQLMPVNSREMGASAAAMLQQNIQADSPGTDLLARKGRAESAAALGLLQREGNKTMNVPMQATRNAWAALWRAGLDATMKLLVLEPRELPVHRFTLDLVGASIDFAEGVVKFEDNLLPDFSRLLVTTEDASPTNDLVTKQEAIELFNIYKDPERFMRYAAKSGLTWAMDLDEYLTAVEAVHTNILMLYQDGETPGQVILNPHTVLPDKQLTELLNFMAGPAMRVATPLVQSMFHQYAEYLKVQMGMMLPEGLPDPYGEEQDGPPQGMPPDMEQMV